MKTNTFCLLVGFWTFPCIPRRSCDVFDVFVEVGFETLDDVDTDDDVETELEKGDFQKKIDITC